MRDLSAGRAGATGLGKGNAKAMMEAAGFAGRSLAPVL